MTINRRQVISLAGATALSVALANKAAFAQSSVQPDGKVDPVKVAAPGTMKEMVYGNADAPVTIVEYASLTCSHCATFANNTLPEIKKKYIDTGKARLIFREFPFDPRATAAFMLARCAPEERYFPMIEVFFKQQAQWAGAADAEAALLQIAKLAGFTEDSFKACLTNQDVLNDVNAVRERGAEFGVNATPTFFINGEKYSGALTVDQMSAVIDKFL